MLMLSSLGEEILVLTFHSRVDVNPLLLEADYLQHRAARYREVPCLSCMV